jgi:hypothetical protein
MKRYKLIRRPMQTFRALSHRLGTRRGSSGVFARNSEQGAGWNDRSQVDGPWTKPSFPFDLEGRTGKPGVAGHYGNVHWSTSGCRRAVGIGLEPDLQDLERRTQLELTSHRMRSSSFRPPQRQRSRRGSPPAHGGTHVGVPLEGRRSRRPFQGNGRRLAEPYCVVRSQFVMTRRPLPDSLHLLAVGSCLVGTLGQVLGKRTNVGTKHSA